MRSKNAHFNKNTLEESCDCRVLIFAVSLCFAAVPSLAGFWDGNRLVSLMRQYEKAVRNDPNVSHDGYRGRSLLFRICHWRTIAEGHSIASTLEHLLSRDSAAAPALPESALMRQSITSLSQRIRSLEDRLRRHVIGPPVFLRTFAALYFAAILVAFGPLLYQMWAHDIIKHSSRSQFVSGALSAFSLTSSDATLRLGDALREVQIASKADADQYHPQLVRCAGGVMWIPNDVAVFKHLPPPL